MKKTLILLSALFSLIFVVKYLDKEDVAEKKSLIIDIKKLSAFTVVSRGSRFTIKHLESHFKKCGFFYLYKKALFVTL